MANDYRILDERDIKNFQAGNKLEVTEIGNKVTYKHIGEPPNTLPSQEKLLEYGESFNITVPSVYDSTGHVKSETKYSFIMPQETNTSNFLTTDNFLSESPIGVNKSGKNITYSHDLSTVNESTTKLSPNDENIISFTALSAVDSCGHANQKTTYNFAIPDTSNYPTKNDFAAVAPLSVAKGENNNTVTYSHGGSSPSKNTEDKSTDLTFGNPFEITIPSAYNNTGHVIETQKHIFTMPAAPNVNTSGFLTKDKFGDEENNPVSKKEENNKIIYYHDNKTITPSTPEPATELKYGEEFNFTALSAADSYGHVNQKTTYKFKMPAAPSGNTTGIITKNDFKANAPLSVTKSEDNNTVTYSHNKPTADTSLKSDGPPKTGNDVNISLSYGNTTSFTALSGIDEYGHAIQKTKYKIAMPAAPAINTNIITISEHKFAYASKSGIHQWGGKTGTANDSITYIDMDLGTFRGCYITVCPNVTGYTFNGTYDDENNESTPIVDVRLFLPGSLTFFTNSLSDFSFKLPRFYALTPTKEAYHGFSYLGKSGAICHLGYSNKQIALYFSCEKSYFNPTLIDKIIITTY